MPARLFPHADVSEIDHAPERMVAQALLRTLDERWEIFHSYPWLKSANGRLQEGECDFVLLHPQEGVAVLEVKGGDIQYSSANARWTQNHKPMKESPLDQARRNMHTLHDKIRQACPDLPPYRFGYAVAFPSCHFKGSPPPGGDPLAMFSADDLAALGPRLAASLQQWGKSKPLSTADFARLRSAVYSDFKLSPALHQEIETGERVLVRLTEQQYQIVQGFALNQRMLVEGPAGSGKTLLAVRRAEDFAAQGLQTLLLCYNRNLAAEFGHRVRHPLIQVATFHSLCAQVCKAANIPFNPDGPAFWKEQAPLLLWDALEEVGHRYDAVLVDEAQDFDPLWWDPIEKGLLKGPQSYFYVFFDRRQNLYARNLEFPRCNAHYRLSFNCRNTVEIATQAARVIQEEPQVSPFSPAGRKVMIQGYPQPGQVARLVEVGLRQLTEEFKLTPSRIAVLTPGSPEKSQVFKPSGVTWTTNSEVWRQGKGIWRSTIKSFKGLEADAVILAELGDFKEGFFDRADLYVACSRAKHVLYLLVSSQALLKELQASGG